ncbi:MAG: hypothetical protein WAW00_01140 [Candidatus Moraniibacteriota bacterium]
MIPGIRSRAFRTILSLSVAMIFSSGGFFSAVHQWPAFIAPAYAEDDEEEDEHEDEEDEEDEHEDDEEPAKTSKVKSAPIYETVFVTKVITTLDPIYATDQDGDKLVDGLDPHPAVPEQEYFTDDDDDSVPNAFDRHPGDDDFAYYEEESDENGDGLLDSYALMGER